MKTLAQTEVDEDNHTKTVTNTDAAGNVTQTVTDTFKDLTLSSTDGNGITTSFTYDELKNLKSLLCDGSNAQTEFTYDNGNLKTVTVNAAGNKKTVYSFDYDGFGDLLSIKIGNKALVTYTYDNKLHSPLTIRYANGTMISHTYDSKGRVLTVKSGSTLNYVYDYDEQGNVYETVDKISRTSTKTIDDVVTVYDYLRDVYLRKYQKTDNGLDETVNGKEYSTKYSNTAKTADVSAYSTVKFGNAEQKTYTDDFGRITEIVTTTANGQIAKQIYSYSQTVKDGKNYTDDLVKSIKTVIGSQSTTESYDYDDNGNIIRKYKNGSLAHTYTYDALNQLTQEYDYTTGVNTIYLYDELGNITRAINRNFTFNNNSGYTYTGGYTDNYSYESDWKEQLTDFNGNDIAYDASGNPNTCNGYVLTWQSGRQLRNAEKNNITYTFNYDDNGIRTSKGYYDSSNYTAESHSYFTVDGLITADRIQGGGMNIQSYDYTVYYVYDSNSQPIGLKYNNRFYAYLKNVQGDILAVLDDSGNKVAEYEYDSWGKVTNATGEMASVNSLRYRGYYYDEEIGLYYLQSRYYDPLTRRFINADEPTLIEDLTKNSILGGNLYAYCGNDAVNKVDPSGEWWYYFKNYYSFCNSHPWPFCYIWLKKYHRFYDNHRTNWHIWGNYKDYIWGQKYGNIGKMIYDRAKIADVGCEIVATYNVMKRLGRWQNFATIIDEFVMNDMQWFGGRFGTHPEDLRRYFNAHSVSYKYYTEINNFDKNAKRGKIAILSYWIGRRGLSMIHTVAIQIVHGRNGKYHWKILNLSSRNKNYSERRYVNNIINGGNFICGYVF